MNAYRPKVPTRVYLGQVHNLLIFTLIMKFLENNKQLRTKLMRASSCILVNVMRLPETF